MRTLSKSDFKIACTCATKLYYKELGYPRVDDEDQYLKLLADGGYMVEEIARIQYEPEGRLLGYQSGTAAAARETADALRARDAVLFEATLLSGVNNPDKSVNGIATRKDIRSACCIVPTSDESRSPIPDAASRNRTRPA